MNSKTSFNIGNVCIGGQNPVVVQSMTNTDTNDVAASVAQVGRMVDAGAQMVRLTVPSLKEVEAMRAIRDRLRAEGIDVPLVADVHFNPKVAEAMASIVEKVRINPGNYVDKRNFSQLDLSDAEYAAAVERMALRAEPLLRICREHGTAIRLGINHGSLCDRIVSRYGNTPNAMVQSALEWLDICEHYDFHKVVVSMKSSNVHTMMEATLTLHQEMERRGRSYPLHLGPPENETPFAHKLVSAVQQLSVNDCSVQDQTLTFASEEQDYDTWVAQASAMAGLAYYNHHIRDVKLANPHFTEAQCAELEAVILQACGIRMSKTEFISCPSCGRTQYDIQSVLSVVKERFSGHPGLKIGVMGCIVNGPGEMADADYGIVGASNGLVCVYEGKKRLTAAITIEEAMSHLETLLENKMD